MFIVEEAVTVQRRPSSTQLFQLVWTTKSQQKLIAIISEMAAPTDPA